MAKMADLEQDNPNVRSQYTEWRQQRTQNGEDGNDYQAFRSHLQAIGAPDPGEEQFAEFGTDVESMDASGSDSNA